MIKTKFTLLWVFTLLASLTSFAQVPPIQDPAVTSATLSTTPLAGIGSTYTATFILGNNGNKTITGEPSNNLGETMQISVCLGKSAANVATGANPIDALSGTAKNWFDFTFVPANDPTNNRGGCFEGIQKANVPISSLGDLVVSLVVTKLSISPFLNDVGASCNIAPNTNAQAESQPQNNDFLSVYTHTTAIAQPVSLVRFTAQAQADRSVLVSWQTSWERANQAYFIERSKDLKNFETVGQVSDVAGSSSSLSSYRFVDSSPYRGTSYYRLRQVDVDGSSQTFKAESVVLEGKYGVYPNPVVGQQFTLELDEPASAVLRLYSASGRELELNRSGSGEASTTVKPAGKLTSGVYLLNVEERGTVRQHRLVVPE